MNKASNCALHWGKVDGVNFLLILVVILRAIKDFSKAKKGWFCGLGSMEEDIFDSGSKTL